MFLFTCLLTLKTLSHKLQGMETPSKWEDSMCLFMSVRDKTEQEKKGLLDFFNYWNYWIWGIIGIIGSSGNCVKPQTVCACAGQIFVSHIYLIKIMFKHKYCRISGYNI